MQTSSILLFGATGHVGRAVATEAKRRDMPVEAVIRSRHRAKQLVGVARKCTVADLTKPSDLDYLLDQHHTVITSVGKSVSPFENSKPSFHAVDYRLNMNILEASIRAGVKKFVYVSAFHSEKYPKLDYFRVHEAFSEKLAASGLDYSIVKPTALYSAFIDLVEMAKSGLLVNIGEGKARTNPIWEGDVAKICLDSMSLRNVVVEAGGPEVMSREDISGLIQKLARPGKKVRRVPLKLVKSVLPILKWADKNSYDKVAFMTTVTQVDTIAPMLGEKCLENYLTEYLGKPG